MPKTEKKNYYAGKIVVNMQKATSAATKQIKHSGLQKEVLKLYRDFLRELNKDKTKHDQLLNHIRTTFRKNAVQISKVNCNT
jgi:hypothetical protein